MWLRIVGLGLALVALAACGGADDADATTRGTVGGVEPMTITFERSGGIAGITRTVTVSTDEMAEADAAELRRLVAESGLFELPADAGAGDPAPDDFVYTITIDDGERTAVVRTGGVNAPGSLRPLLDWLNRALRSGGG
jgi:hypothetical protein